MANNTGQAGKQAKSQLFQILGVTSPQDLLAEDGQIGIGGRDATDEDLKLIAACYLFSGKGEPLDREEELLFQKWQATYPKIAETARKMVDNQQD